MQRGFGHDPTRFGEFKARHHTELAVFDAAGALTEGLTRRSVVTLLYAAHSPDINQMAVLQEILSDLQVTS